MEGKVELCEPNRDGTSFCQGPRRSVVRRRLERQPQLVDERGRPPSPSTEDQKALGRIHEQQRQRVRCEYRIQCPEQRLGDVSEPILPDQRVGQRCRRCMLLGTQSCEFFAELSPLHCTGEQLTDEVQERSHRDVWGVSIRACQIQETDDLTTGSAQRYRQVVP